MLPSTRPLKVTVVTTPSKLSDSQTLKRKKNGEIFLWALAALWSNCGPTVVQLCVQSGWQCWAQSRLTTSWSPLDWRSPRTPRTPLQPGETEHDRPVTTRGPTGETRSEGNISSPLLPPTSQPYYATLDITTILSSIRTLIQIDQIYLNINFWIKCFTLFHSHFIYENNNFLKTL